MPNSFNMFGPQKKLKRKKNIVEFRAGKMKLDQNNWVYPDNRKGLVFIHQTQDGKMHFCWKDRLSDLVEDDFILFPQDAIFKRLPECTTGRVYLLKFKNSKKLFLWMQEPREEKDAEFCRLVNEVLNRNQSETAGSGTKDLNMVEFTNLLGQLNDIGALNEIDLMEILGLTQGFESHATAESDVSNVYALNTNPFQIRSNISSLTFADQSAVVNEQKVTPVVNKNENPSQSRPPDITSINSDSTKTAIVDPNSVFTEHTLTQLSKNSVFKARVLSINNPETNQEVDICSENFKTAVRNFGMLLSDKSTGRVLLTEMGLPESIVNKSQENGNTYEDLASLINDLEEYYKNKKDNNN